MGATMPIILKRHNKKIDPKVLKDLLREGKTVTQCAEFFACSPSAISQAKSKLSIAVVDDAAWRAHEITNENIDMMQQLTKTNKILLDSIDRFERIIAGDTKAIDSLRRLYAEGNLFAKKGGNSVSFKDPQELLLKLIGELRMQAKLYMDIAAQMHDHEEVQNFQAAVLEVIGNERPEIRQRIVNKLIDRKKLHGFTQINH